MENIEIEYKYSADEISRKDFEKVAIGLEPNRQLLLKKESAIDYYFTRGVRFMRFRHSGGEDWELTTKVKLSKTNNQVRMETNVNLGPGMSYEKAKSFANGCEFEPDFSISKEGVVYWFDKIVLSYYTSFNAEGQKLDTFLEIECLESYPWESETQALEELVEWEKKLASLGINSYKRVRKSLFEFYTTIGT